MKDLFNRIIEKLDPDATINDIRICDRATYAVGARLGMAYNFRHGCGADKISDNGDIATLPALPARACEVARLALSKDWIEASVGVAAINTTTEIPEGAKQMNGKEIIWERCRGRRVAMIGHFRFTDELRKIAGHLDVLELRQSEGDLPAEAAPEVTPLADVTIITGTTLVNHTFEKIARLARNSFSIVLGPTSIMSPVLFEYGIDAICGTVVTDSSNVIEFLANGGSFRDLKYGVEQLAIFSNQ